MPSVAGRTALSTAGDVVLPQVPLFSSLSPEAFVQLSHAMVMQKAKPGTKEFRAALKEERPLQVPGAICAYHATLAKASGFKAD